MSEELKACLCGSDVHISELITGSKWAITCSNCGICMDSWTTKERLIEKWNTRPIEDAMQAEIDRLIELQRKMPLVADRRGAELSHLRAQHTRLIDQCKRLAEELLGYVGADGNAPGSVELSNFDRLMKELEK